MRSPSLEDLPNAPQDKTGWPWTKESHRLPELMPNGLVWPKISIVTPNYNFGNFLEETVRSVLLQGYPNLEYIIVDDCSTDNSSEVIKKYEKWMICLKTESNQGTVKAVNKGFQKSSGGILNWLNSDDVLLPNALMLAAVNLAEHLNNLMIVYGLRLRCNENGNIFDFDIPPGRVNRLIFRTGSWIPNETAFFTSLTYRKAGGLSMERVYALDYDFWLRCLSIKTKFKRINEFMGVMRFHPRSKSCVPNSIYRNEYFKIRQELLGRSFLDKLLNKSCDFFLTKFLFWFNKFEKKGFVIKKQVLIPSNINAI